ncbi:MAG: DUF2141 domain-containing protein [Bacteroidota bacterium]
MTSFSPYPLYRRVLLVASFVLATGVFSGLAYAQDATITVSVAGVSSDKGEIKCSLFDQADAYPDKYDNALLIDTQTADPDGTTCRFEGLAAGTYALAVFHDKNTNGKLDTNFVGAPKEDWAASNDARPSLRKPRFSEAAFTIADGQTLALDLEVR